MWWVLVAPSARAVDVCVVGCPYATPQAAIDEQETDLDLLDELVPFPFDVPVGRTVTVNGKGEPVTVLVSEPYQPMITVRAGATLVLNDVEITGDPSSPSIDVSGGTLEARGVSFRAPLVGVHATTGAFVTLDDCAFEDGLGEDGAGITASDADVTVTASTFTRMSAIDRGGAISAVRSALSVVDSSFVGGVAVSGGAIDAEDTDVTIDGVLSTFTGNSAGAGGAVAITGGSLVVTAATFSMNGAFAGGHLSAVDAEVTLDGAQLSYGDADADGGAVRADGGLVVLDGVGSTYNGAGLRGGALALTGADLEVYGTSFFGDDSVVSGGAIQVVDAPTLVRVEGSTFELTVSDRGGGLAVDHAARVELTDAIFRRAQSAGDGGAVALDSVDAVRIDASTFAAVDASGRGGAVAITGSRAVDLTASAFCDTAALTTADGPGRGGALWIAQSCAVAGDCVVEGNLFVGASADDASVVLVEEGDVVVRNATVIGASSSPDGGFAVADAGGVLRVDGTIVLSTGGAGVVAVNGGIATTGEIVVDAGLSTFDGNGGPVTEEQPIREEPVQLLVVPRQSMTAELPCGLESRPHPQFGLVGTFQGADFGAYGGTSPLPAWLADGDGDLAPWVHDCDDDDALVSGLRTEACENGVDDDCDGLVDGADPSAGGAWYGDGDGDGAFTREPVYVGCDPDPSWRPEPGDDCDDGDGGNFPGNAELCNGTDDDCDAVADEPDEVEQPIWTVDLDGDGYAVEIAACPEPDGAVTGALGGDCDDADAEVHPGALERLDDGVDQDCDLGDARGFVTGGACGCASVRGGAPWALLAGLALLVQRTRRSSGSGSRGTSGRAQKS